MCNKSKILEYRVDNLGMSIENLQIEIQLIFLEYQIVVQKACHVCCCKILWMHLDKFQCKTWIPHDAFLMFAMLSRCFRHTFTMLLLHRRCPWDHGLRTYSPQNKNAAVSFWLTHNLNIVCVWNVKMCESLKYNKWYLYTTINSLWLSVFCLFFKSFAEVALAFPGFVTHLTPFHSHPVELVTFYC